MTDPIADMLTRIRNANIAAKDEVVVPASTMKEAHRGDPGERGIRRATSTSRARAKDAAVDDPAEVRHAAESAPSRAQARVQARPARVRGRDEIPRVLGGLGIAILSTSQGVLTDRQARSAGVGGEVIAYVW